MGGGEDIFCNEELEYQVVTPGDPEEKARCCLTGTREVGGSVDWLVVFSE